MNNTFKIVALALLVGCKSKEEPVATTARAVTATPADTVFAASSQVRVVDVAQNRVAAQINFSKAVRAIVFTPDARLALVGASDGVRAIDTSKNEVLAKLSNSPVRQLELDAAGQRLFVLEHDVTVHPDGRREPQPFRLTTIDLTTFSEVSREEIGQRILYARAPTADRHGVVLTEIGQVRIIAPGQKLSEGTDTDIVASLPSSAGVRGQINVAASADHVYLPFEGGPSRIVDVDLATGQISSISLDRTLPLRGAAVSPDGRSLFVSSGDHLYAIDLATRSVRGALELGAAHASLALSSDGRFAYLPQTIDGDGGAVRAVDLTSFTLGPKVHLDDITPYTLGVMPKVAFAGAR